MQCNPTEELEAGNLGRLCIDNLSVVYHHVLSTVSCQSTSGLPRYCIIDVMNVCIVHLSIDLHH